VLNDLGDVPVIRRDRYDCLIRASDFKNPGFSGRDRGPGFMDRKGGFRALRSSSLANIKHDLQKILQ
jgi:hypothetical protein